jgi:FkbM family methyltransferase
MTPTMRVMRALSRAGLNRSTIIRRLVHLGHPRLRELRTRAFADRDPLGLALGPFLRWLERGVLHIPQPYTDGLKLDLRYLPLSHAQLGSIAFGNLETAVQEAMVRHLGPGGVFYDIGANLGFFSLIGAHLVGVDQGKVYAFEAAPDNARAIRKNTELNRLSNVTVIDKAVSSRSGKGRLQIVDDRSWSKLEEYGPHPHAERTIDVELVAIDDLLQTGAIAPPTVVKIDVEGAEIAVLEGMRTTIERHHPAVICELHGTQSEFIGTMNGQGYRLINLAGAGPIEEAGGSAYALALPALDPGD